MNRWFNDMDVRLTNTSIENVSLTAYGTIYNEDEQTPNTAAVTSVNQGPEHGRTSTLPTRPDARAAHRLSQVHGRPERHVAALGLRLRPGRAGDRRRL